MFVKYRRKYAPDAPTVEAVMLTKENVSDVVEWCGGQQVEEVNALNHGVKFVGVNVPTFAGMVRASEGDYVVKDKDGEFHRRKPSIFEAKYVVAEENEVEEGDYVVKNEDGTLNGQKADDFENTHVEVAPTGETPQAEPAPSGESAFDDPYKNVPQFGERPNGE